MGCVVRPAPAAAVPLVLVPALGLSQGGFTPHAWVWTGGLAAWAAALAVVLSDDAGALRDAWPWLASAGALLAWTLLSALWSVDAGQSVLDARRTLAYTAVLLALVALARRRAAASLVVATHLGITFLVVYALARYLLGGHHATFEQYLLADPLGYANAVGIVAVLGALLALGIASRTVSRPGRAAAAATLPLLALALELSGSHASWLALAIGLAAALPVDEKPLPVVRTLGCVLVPSAAAVVLGHESGLAAFATPRIDGAVVAAAAGGCALVAATLADRFGTPAARTRRPATSVLVAAAVAAAAVAVALIAVYGAARAPRSLYYRVAWHHEYAAHPLLGSGAGTFGSYWNQFGDVVAYGGALDAHSLYLETLAELGPVGLVLVLTLLLYPLRAASAARRQPYVPVAVSAYTAFLVHAGLDWDWEMPVVVVAGLACAAALISAALPGPRRLGTTTRAAVLGTTLAIGALAIAGVGHHTMPSAAGYVKGGPALRDPLSSTRDERGYDLP